MAIAVTLVLLELGAGLGFAAASPLKDEGASATTWGVTAAIWLIVTQWLSSGVGGYITGRLRTRWAGTHRHEVFFRDTAHGFLTWAVATLGIAVVLAFAGSAIVGSAVDSGTKLVASAAQGAASGAASNSSLSSYDVETLFRSAQPSGNVPATQTNGEATRILARSLKDGDISQSDREYLATQIAARTGVSKADADRRVADVIARVKAADTKLRLEADAARKAAATAAILGALSMLMGAFIASVAAALGGRQRDLHP
ncbi:MAG: hypothetical protein ABIT61_09005 [Steroidobacteraceae bacterium]